VTTAADPQRQATYRWAPQLGALMLERGTQFRVWAPACQTVEVSLQSLPALLPLEPEKNGYFSALIPGIGKGTKYSFRLDGAQLAPDPCSRYQPQGPHGPSEVMDPSSYHWSDSAWPGIEMPGQILYEMHVGTFTNEGTFLAAARHIPELKDLGITTIELMPLNECAGKWNWGYDGVDLFAPYHVYGVPDDLKRFVDLAHKEGLGVILDVVYNHLGPDGNYLGVFSKRYFTDRYKNEWGQPINFDGADSRGVRDFVVENACYWISEFHMDGLRVDATHNIYDAGPVHIIAELSDRARQAADPRKIILIGENEPQDIRYATPQSEGGYGLDALWNDDFHHTARVAATGFREAYFTDYRGSPQEFVSLAKRGYLFQGQHYFWHKKPRGFPITNQAAAQFVVYLQNHDQIANALGKRMPELAGPALYRALFTTMALMPCTPMLFMGQEFGASTPFYYFANHEGQLGDDVSKGRKKFLGQFPSFQPKLENFPDSQTQEAFSNSKLSDAERKSHENWRLFHRDLLWMRRLDPVFASQDRRRLDGAVLEKDVFLLRFFGRDSGDRLLVVNLGDEVTLEPIPEPLLAPPLDRPWTLSWASDDRRYGGDGKSRRFFRGQGWHLPMQTAVLFGSGQKTLGSGS